MPDVGSGVAAFRKAAYALGVIGFSKSVDWVDSATFVLALLPYMQSHSIFQQSQSPSRHIARLVDRLRYGAYESLAGSLGLDVAWAAGRDEKKER